MNKLALDFLPAILPNGNINSQWRRKFSAQGNSLLQYYNTDNITEAWFLSQGNIKGKCKTCDNSVSFSSKTKSYSSYCSVVCGQKSQDVQNKKKSTNLLKYGTEIAGGFGTQSHKNAMFKKYGATHPMQSEQIKAKQNATNIIRYGTSNVFANSLIKQKIKNTVNDRYKVDHVMQVDSIKQKFRGVNNEWIPAVTNTEIRKTNTFSTICTKIKNRLNEQLLEVIEFDSGFSYANQHTIKCLVCDTVFKSPIYSGAIPRCYICNPLLAGTSKLQQKVEDYITSLNIDIITKKRMLGNKELDIFIPSHNLGIEINGLYWHSELAGIDKNYHLNKTETAAKLNIKLLHLFEDDIVQHWEIVKSIINSQLNLNSKLGARKCSIIKVDAKVAKEFCETNHLKGSAKFTSAIGLMFKEELVAVATFNKPRYDKSADFEIIRFCTKLGLTVVAGFSKIISAFEYENPKKVLLSYADRCYSTGNVYYKAGFTLLKITPPNYWYFDKTNIRVHQTQLRKYKLSRIYDDINSMETEWENLQRHGWNRVWDCGQLVFIKTPDCI